MNGTSNAAAAAAPNTAPPRQGRADCYSCTPIFPALRARVRLDWSARPTGASRSAWQCRWRNLALGHRPRTVRKEGSSSNIPGSWIGLAGATSKFGGHYLFCFLSRSSYIFLALKGSSDCGRGAHPHIPQVANCFGCGRLGAKSPARCRCRSTLISLPFLSVQ